MSVVGETDRQVPVEVRAAEPEELGALVAVALTAARSDLAWAGKDWISPDPVLVRQLWWDRLRDERTWVAAAVSGFTHVGAATAWPAPTLQGRAPKLAYLIGPIVDPEWWGEGIGTALLEQSLAVLAQLRFARAEVAIPAGNRRGRRFLERRGWQAERPRRRSPMAIVTYGLDLGGATIENRSQYAA
jgi:GNAT superfamily N-acetyltransferase